MQDEPQTESHGIGTLNEGPLHEELKQWYARPGDRLEVPVEGYVVDIVRGDVLIEIQTGGFSAIKRKIRTLVANHKVRLVYPIARDRWIVRLDDDGRNVLGKRRSPKHGTVRDIFSELVRMPDVLARPDFSLDLLLTQEEELRRHEPGRAWRRKGWIVVERRLVSVLESRPLRTVRDAASLLPADLPEEFTTLDVAEALAEPRTLAQRMAYCLRAMGAIQQVGKQGRSVLYRRRAA